MNVFNPMTVLTEGQPEKIRDATEEVLEKTGASVQHEGLLRYAKKSGARVDEASGRVRIPKSLLRELLATVPSTCLMRGVLGEEREIGLGTPHLSAIVTDPWIVDYETRTPRRPCLDDLYRHTILAQKFDSVAFVSRMDYPVTDFDDATSSLRALEIHLLNHTKHNAVFAASTESFDQWLAIGRVLAQDDDLTGSHLFTCAVAVNSPLTLNRMNADILLKTCAHQFCVLPTVCPMAGTTSPYTLASTLLLANCEIVFAAALSQAINPGNPFLYALGPSVSDMRSGRDRYYTLDKVLWKSAGVQMAKEYGIPCTAECGGTMNHRYDLQSGAEGMLFMLAAYCSGADILAGLGSCYNANGMSAEMMVVQHAWLEAAKFLQKGIDTDDLRLGLRSILATAPGEHFLTDDLTFEFLRGNEFFASDIFDYSDECEPGPSLLDRAHSKVEALIDGYTSPVPGPVQERLRRYFHDIYARMGSLQE